jgi:hypothetical protein
LVGEVACELRDDQEVFDVSLAGLGEKQGLE